MQLQAREKRTLILGAIVATLLLAYLLWPRNAPRETTVDLVPAEKRQGAGTPAAPAPVTPAPAPSVPVAAQPTQPVQPAQQTPAASPLPEGLRLTGVTGRGAIFSFPDGSQRLVTRGRDVAPGVTLQAVRLREVVLAVGATNYRLGFGGAAIPVQPPSVAVVVAPSAAPAPAAPAPAGPRTVPPPPPVAAPSSLPNVNLAR